jgi:hypothetical protein
VVITLGNGLILLVFKSQVFTHTWICALIFLYLAIVSVTLIINLFYMC